MTRQRGFPSDFGLLLLVSFLVSFGVAISHGRYSEPALACIAVAFAVLVWRFAMGLRATAPTMTSRPRLVLTLIWVGLVTMQLTALFDPKLVVYPHAPLSVLRGVEIASVLALATYLPFFGTRREPMRLRRARFAVFGALTLTAGLATICISPAPLVDVWDVQMRGAEALLRGENPYVTVTVADTNPEWHGLGLHPVPYVYSPGSLYIGSLGFLVGKDVRYATLLAMMVAGVALRLIATATNRNGVSTLTSLEEDAPALFVWLMPPLFFVLEQSWIDPIQLVLLCAAVAAHVTRRPVVAATLIGIALASKQSMFWLVPLAGFVLRFRPREWILMVVAWGVLLAPFAIADLHALKYATVDFLLGLPPRGDALSATVWLKRTFGCALPGVVAFALAAAAVGAAVLAACMAARTAADATVERDGTVECGLLFARATAVTYFAFFFFNKWAFANYYFFIAGLAALAAAASLHARGARASTLQ